MLPKRYFPGGSAGKESACNSGSPVQSMGGEDPLEKGMTTPPVFLPGESRGQRSLAGYSPWGSQSQTHFHTLPSWKMLHWVQFLLLFRGKAGFTKDTLILLGKVLSLTHRHLRTNFSENRVLSRMCGTDCDLCHKLCL